MKPSRFPVFVCALVAVLAAGCHKSPPATWTYNYEAPQDLFNGVFKVDISEVRAVDLGVIPADEVTKIPAADVLMAKPVVFRSTDSAVCEKLMASLRNSSPEQNKDADWIKRGEASGCHGYCFVFIFKGRTAIACFRVIQYVDASVPVCAVYPIWDTNSFYMDGAVLKVVTDLQKTGQP